MVRLHVLSEGVLQASFCLCEGVQWLGSGLRADLTVKASLAPALLCRVDLTPDGRVVVRTGNLEHGSPALRLSDGTAGDVVAIPNGDFADIAGLRLLVLSQPDDREVQVHFQSNAPHAAQRSPLALRVRTGRATKVILLGDACEVRIGRSSASDLVLLHPDVSRNHARLQRRPDGLWLEDLGSSHGTSIDGVRIRAAPLPLGSTVAFSSAHDAPTLTVLTLEEVLADLVDELVSPLRGKSEAMRQVREAVAHLGASGDPVLVTGEPGTGKGLVAGALARVRDSRPPLGGDCSALPGDVLESLLFGFRRGAFDGADQEYVGCFEAASGGTVFLDEVGDLPPPLQLRVLQVLEERSVVRLGERRQRPVQFRLVAATRHDLDELTGAGRFDADLRGRVGAGSIHLPPLRQHRADIADLARAALRSLEGPNAGKTLSHGALDKLRHHEWPGNVEELLATVKIAALATDEIEIPMEAVTLPPAQAEEPRLRRICNLPAHLEDLERAHCLKIVMAAHGDLGEAAGQMGWTPDSLKWRLDRWGWKMPRGQSSQPRAH